MLEQISIVVKQASIIMMESSSANISRKLKTDERNIVTEYDKRVQDYLFSQLQEIERTAVMIGEEGEEVPFTSDGKYFIVDPIDGTSNFIKNANRSCISVAYIEDGRSKAAVVYDPYLDEIYTAERGRGAYLNRERIVNHDVTLESSIVCFGTCPYDLEKSESVFKVAHEVFKNCLDLRRTGSAALEICYTANNRYDLFFEFILYPWDYAAASLIVEEAGGTARSFNQDRVDLSKRSSVLTGSRSAVNGFLELIDTSNL